MSWEDAIKRCILSELLSHRGQDNRISRDGLREAISNRLLRRVGDRKMRSMIEELRREHDLGALICSSSSGGGYWLAANLDELLASYREERRRAINTMVTARERLRRGKAVLGGQLDLWGIQEIDVAGSVAAGNGATADRQASVMD